MDYKLIDLFCGCGGMTCRDRIAQRSYQDPSPSVVQSLRLTQPPSPIDKAACYSLKTDRHSYFQVILNGVAKMLKNLITTVAALTSCLLCSLMAVEPPPTVVGEDGIERIDLNKLGTYFTSQGYDSTQHYAYCERFKEALEGTPVTAVLQTLTVKTTNVSGGTSQHGGTLFMSMGLSEMRMPVLFFDLVNFPEVDVLDPPFRKGEPVTVTGHLKIARFLWANEKHVYRIVDWEATLGNGKTISPISPITRPLGGPLGKFSYNGFHLGSKIELPDERLEQYNEEPPVTYYRIERKEDYKSSDTVERFRGDGVCGVMNGKVHYIQFVMQNPDIPYDDLIAEISGLFETSGDALKIEPETQLADHAWGGDNAIAVMKPSRLGSIGVELFLTVFTQEFIDLLDRR